MLAHNPQITYGDQLDNVPGWYNNKNVSQADEALTVETANGSSIKFAPGSVVVDPWRKLPSTMGIQVVHYGNTRAEAPR